MLLSVESYAVRKKLGDKEAFRLIKNAGFDCVDYSYYWFDGQKESEEYEERLLGEDYAEAARELRKELDSLGLPCNQAHAPLLPFRKGGVPDESDPSFVKIAHSVESAGILGAGSIIVHALGARDGKSAEEVNREYYARLRPYAEKAHIRIAIENLCSRKPDGTFSGLLADPAVVTRMVKNLGSDCFCACVDVGHVNILGLDPAAFIGGFDADTLLALHIHDNDGRDDDHMLPYTRDMNWDSICKALKDMGYKKDLTLEIFNFLKRFPNELLPEALAFACRTGRSLIVKITD